MKFETHQFTSNILNILEDMFPSYSEEIFENSPLLIYLNIKTKSANKGSKSRGSFANHYALYVLIEDYINKGYFENKNKNYFNDYEGAQFTNLFKRQRELPFGQKLQNHAINSRLNDEFIKYFPTIKLKPIIRDTENQKYWIEENLLKVKINEKEFNLAKAILKIIDTYVETKKESFQNFLDACLEIHHLNDSNKLQAYEFIKELIGVSVDARIFEIVSFAILKEKYANESIFIGETLSSVKEESLTLYKTGRTNANDGGIDFVMKPIGRFYQVTETIDVNKYFLDIDKVQKFPITFVIKSDKESNEIKQQIQEQATQKYKVPSIINKYMSCIEEIINVNDLMNIFNNINENGKIQPVINEIIIQSKVEFNYQEEEIEELLEATKENLEISLESIEEDEE